MADVLPARERDSLAAWFSAHMSLEAGRKTDNKVQAKARDSQAFLAVFVDAMGGGEADGPLGN